MSASSKLFQFGKQHIARGIGRSTELVVERAQGAYVWTVDGKSILILPLVLVSLLLVSVFSLVFLLDTGITECMVHYRSFSSQGC